LRKRYPLLLFLLVLLSCNLVNAPTPASLTATVLAITPTNLPTRNGPNVTPGTSGIQGSVEWEAGRCCAGGIAGETIQLQADFEAEDSAGVVQDMRVATGGMCFDEVKMANADWEPFVQSKEYPFQVALNWVGYYISVQYRDAQGNISPIYCDDISIEGSPAAP
jgi:hypothetical protein